MTIAMTLIAILKERAKKTKALREDALKEAKRLVLLLKNRFEFETVYICGSLLSGKFGPHSDIDMVIKGSKMEDFFKVYALLIKESKYKIDLKPFEDMMEDFKEKVLTEGMKIG